MLRDIPGYPGYMASENGEIFSCKRNQYLKPSISKYGYARVTLYKNNGEKHKVMVHRLVAMTFLANPGQHPQVNHKNENRLDNRAENLEWCSSTYNINYGGRNAAVSEKLRVFKERTVAKRIEQINPTTGEVVKCWDSLRQIERETGIAHSNIYNCCRGKRKTRGGFIWKYAS